MAKNNNYNKKNKQKKEKEKKFVNPASRLWGKILITILALAMCLGGLASLIYLIIQSIIS